MALPKPKQRRCSICRRPFGWFRWRHPCENPPCNKVVCSKCLGGEGYLSKEVTERNYKKYQLCAPCLETNRQNIREDQSLRDRVRANEEKLRQEAEDHWDEVRRRQEEDDEQRRQDEDMRLWQEEDYERLRQEEEDEG